MTLQFAKSLDRIDARLRRYSYDAATPITTGTWGSAYRSAPTALDAVIGVLDNGRQVTFALCRLPVHYAGSDYLGGIELIRHNSVYRAGYAARLAIMALSGQALG